MVRLAEVLDDPPIYGFARSAPRDGDGDSLRDQGPAAGGRYNSSRSRSTPSPEEPPPVAPSCRRRTEWGKGHRAERVERPVDEPVPGGPAGRREGGWDRVCTDGREGGGVEGAEPLPSLELGRGTELVGQPEGVPARAGGIAAAGDRPDDVDGLGVLEPALDVEQGHDGPVGRTVGNERAGSKMGAGGGRRQDDGEQEQRGQPSKHRNRGAIGGRDDKDSARTNRREKEWNEKRA